MKLIYPGDEKGDFEFIFGLIRKYYAYEAVPRYAEDTEAVKKVKGVVERSKADYYQSFFDKGTNILIQINQGHFFENGNKRLALVVFVFFVLTNDYRFKSYAKGEYKDKLEQLFPEYPDFVDLDRFDATDFAYYNLSLIIAASKKYNIGFDELKFRVGEYIDFSVEHE